MDTTRLSRLLAPLALLACVLAVGAVAMSTLGGDDSSSRTASSTRAEGSRTSTAKRTSTGKQRKTYVVKSGDSLSLIAEKTGVDVEVIVRLNPGVDPQSLRTGQKLKLAES